LEGDVVNYRNVAAPERRDHTLLKKAPLISIGADTSFTQASNERDGFPMSRRDIATRRSARGFHPLRRTMLVVTAAIS
jgi:hypothetical protein